MGWWSRLVGRTPEPKHSGEENLLVISDIHLGEDILIEGPEHLAEYIRALNRGLADFVAAHRTLGVDGRSWHLVINGDMFDFVKVSLRPEPQEAYAQWSRGGPEATGDAPIIPNTAENVVWKLARILEIHRPLFRQLAGFVMEGNRLTLTEGNHDAEFYFPEVRQALRDELVRLADQMHAREKRDEPFDAAAVGARVQFRVWFEASPGRFHIEHGHQHDEYCSFEYQLAPYDTQDAQTLATPMTHKAMPYFAELLGDFSTHGFEDQGALLRMARHILMLGPRVVLAVARAYIVVAWEMMRRSGAKRRAEIEALREKHRERLRSLVDEAPYGFSTLEKLDRLTATPAEFSLWKTIRTTYIDRFLVGGLMALGLVPIFFLPFWEALLLVAAVILVGGFVQWLLAVTRISDLPEELRSSAARIAELTGVRYVIFGHSHHPELVNLRERYGVGRFGEQAFYLNSGSWVTREILLGEHGKGMTYVEITSRGAALKRWVGPEHKPALLASTDGDLMLADLKEASRIGPGPGDEPEAAA